MNLPGYPEVFLSVLLLTGAFVISRVRQFGVEKDMLIGSVRAFVQLVAVGYALDFIFDMESVWMIWLTLGIMTVVGAQTASGRVKNLDGAFVVGLISIGTGSALTLAVMLAFDIIQLEARYIIPLGGMIVGNSMNASALAVERLTSEIRSNREMIETGLSLGKTWREATRELTRKASVAGMTSMLNSLKTLGIVALPGAMTGMILAGQSPLKAVQIQIIIMYMLVSATTITSALVVELTIRRFFTPHHQLIIK